MAYLRKNYGGGNEPPKARPPARRPDPGPAYGVRDPEFENLALKNISGSITVYRVTNDFIVGLADGPNGASA